MENGMENIIPERLSVDKETSIIRKIREKLDQIDGGTKGIELQEVDELNNDHLEYFIITSKDRKTRRCFPKRKGIEESIMEYIDELVEELAE
ncbi:MAG: hypothetical protein ABH884_02540 [Candidatus Komeilibacteria bacterium]